GCDRAVCTGDDGRGRACARRRRRARHLQRVSDPVRGGAAPGWADAERAPAVPVAPVVGAGRADRDAVHPPVRTRRAAGDPDRPRRRALRGGRAHRRRARGDGAGGVALRAGHPERLDERHRRRDQRRRQRGGDHAAPRAPQRRPWAARTAPVSFFRWRLDMRRSTPWMCAIVMVATSGCKQISDQYAKIKQTIEAKIAQRRGRVPTPPPPAPVPPRASADTPLTATAPPPAPAPPAGGRRHVAQAPEIARPARDVPYESPDTGTIAPGMGEKDIFSLWGPPIAVRHQGEMTFLYFRNGCEYTCGTEDVVFLRIGPGV